MLKYLTTAAIAGAILLSTTNIPAVAETRANAAGAEPQVLIRTSEGNIIVQLDRENAPVTVENFLSYASEGFYEGTIFHRVIRDFMIQGGGYTADFNAKRTRSSIINEADNGLKNLRGTIAMARTSAPHSATAQFFINTVDNPNLDHRAPSRTGWGYAVFGKVVEGMDIVDRIRDMPTSASGPFPSDVPRTTVVIERVEIMQQTAGTAE